MPVTLLTREQYAAKGAVCLDGGPPAFYYKAANPRASSDPEASSSWILHFKGGGWCYNEEDCASRAAGELGNSSHFPATFGFGGILDESPTVSPVFAGFNRVILWTCDGASFSGDRREPLDYQGKRLYFRGRRVLDAILDVLLDPQGPYDLNKATQVMVSGGSAGGLATYLHADYIAARMPKSVKKFRAVPLSGLFPLQQPFSNAYNDEMRYLFQMQNSTAGVNADCTAAGHGWRCIFANYSYAYSRTPFFPLQSSLDYWQLHNILRFDRSCARRQFDDCTAGQIDALNIYSARLVQDFQRTAKYSRAGEGGFVASCLEHCACQGSSFDKYEIAGVKAIDAVGTWWAGDGTEPAAWYLPCSLNAARPHQCNPSCGTSIGGPLTWSSVLPDFPRNSGLPEASFITASS